MGLLGPGLYTEQATPQLHLWTWVLTASSGSLHRLHAICSHVSPNIENQRIIAFQCSTPREIIVREVIVMAIPAGAPFSMYIHENILTPLISRLDFMLMEKHFDVHDHELAHTTSPDDQEEFDKIIKRVQGIEVFGKILMEERSLIGRFDQVEKYIDSIFESIAAHKLLPGKIRTMLDTLRNQIVGIRDAIQDRKVHAHQEQSVGADGEGLAPMKATDPVRALCDGEEMAYLRRAVSAMAEPLKSCLLSLAAFPEGAVIKKRLLIHWWIGEQLVEDADNGEKRFKELVDMKFVRGIIRDSCKETEAVVVNKCTVHPWIRRMIAAVANSTAFMEVDQDGISSNDLKRTRRACLHNGKSMLTTHSRLHFHPEVSSIYNIDQKYVKLSSDWFAKKTCLGTLQLGQWRVFDEENKAADAKKFHVELIHDEHLKGIGACSNLRYLSLRGISRIDAIPDAVGSLSELVVLDLSACYNLQKLNKAITKLRKLQYLDVSECYLLVEMPKGLGNISSLQVLKGFVVANSARKNACRLTDLAHLNKLHKISIRIGKKAMNGRHDELKELNKLSEVTSLRVTWGVMIMTSEKDDAAKDGGAIMLSLPLKLQKLDLQCFPSKRLGQLISTQGLSNLKKLYVTGGLLDSLCEIKDLNIKLLRFRCLKYLQGDDYEKDLGEKYETVSREGSSLWLSLSRKDDYCSNEDITIHS